MTEKRLDGVRVLVIEDEAIVTMLVEDMLADLGCAVAGAASRLDDALSKVSLLEFDLAILDLNLDGSRTDPVAAALVERGIPFVLATGYGAGGVPEAFRGFPLLAKPFPQGDLERALATALAGTTQGPP